MYVIIKIDCLVFRNNSFVVTTYKLSIVFNFCVVFILTNKTLFNYLQKTIKIKSI